VGDRIIQPYAIHVVVGEIVNKPFLRKRNYDEKQLRLKIKVVKNDYHTIMDVLFDNNEAIRVADIVKMGDFMYLDLESHSFYDEENDVYRTIYRPNYWKLM
jgi:hypothetical protein